MPKAMIYQKDRKLDIGYSLEYYIVSILKANYNNPMATCQHEQRRNGLYLIFIRQHGDAKKECSVAFFLNAHNLLQTPEIDISIDICRAIY